jgi:hypothetical protein
MPQSAALDTVKTKQASQPWKQWVDAARAAIVDSAPFHKVTIMAGNPANGSPLMKTPRGLYPESDQVERE